MQISPAVTTQSAADQISYSQYLAKHCKHPKSTKEYNERLALFLQNQAEVKRINSDPRYTSKVETNFISDLYQYEKA